MIRRALLVSLLVACGGEGAPPPSAPSTCGKDATPPPAAVAEKKTPRGIDDVAKELVARFNARDADGVVALFGPSMAAAFPVDKQKPIIDEVLAERGRLGPPKRIESDGSTRHAVYATVAERGEWHLVVDVDGDGRVIGLRIKNPPEPEPPVVKSAIPLGLPFKGEWLVFWGGDTLETNSHLKHPSQRRAADLDKVDASGKSHKGDGKKNEDYFTYGQEILAVADGIVAMVLDGLPDNEPGAMNGYVAPGNAVLVKHTESLFSFYAHLQPGKHRVKVGVKVKRGDVLGIAGNSGNSSEPHLHFQLQDGPRFEKSWGVEAVFAGVNVTRAGKTTKESAYAFLKGDRIAP